MRSLLREEIIDVVVVNHLFFESIGAGLFGSYHFDALGKIPSFAGLQ